MLALAAPPPAAVVEAVPRDVAAAETGVWLLSQRTRITGPRSGPTLTALGARLSRIDPASGRDLRRIDLPVAPGRLAQGWTGRLWVLGSALVVVEPRTGARRVRAGERCTALLADARPGIWSWSPCARELVRRRPDGGRSGTAVRLAGGRVVALALGRDGLFVLRRTRAGAVVERRSPADGGLLRRARVPGPPAGLALRGGSLWALGGRPAAVARLAPRTLRRQARIPLAVPAAAGARLAVGGGAAWATSPAPAATITRIDPRTERPRTRPLAPLPPATMPVALATGPRAVWAVALSDGTRGALCRLDPRDGAVERCFPRSR